MQILETWNVQRLEGIDSRWLVLIGSLFFLATLVLGFSAILTSNAADKKTQIICRICTISVVSIISVSFAGVLYIGNDANEVTQYKTVVTDKTTLEKNQYIIVEHIKDDMYILEKDN